MVILLSGKATSGKSTAADVIFQKYHCDVVACADYIKLAAKEWFNWDGTKDERGRKLLQSLGDVGRTYDKNLWVNTVAKRIERFSKGLTVVPDIRYPNEIQVLQQFPCVTIRIERNGVEQMSHSSETALDTWDSWDYVVSNNGTLEEFKSKILEVIECCLKR